MDTGIVEASKTGDTERLKQLINNGFNVNEILHGMDGDRALQIAAEYGQVDVIRILLGAGADINAEGWSKKTAVHLAAQKGEVRALVALVNAGADVNASDEDHGIALHDAALYGEAYAVKILVDNGADVNWQDEELTTPLHNAAVLGHTEVIKTLLEAGCEINAKDKDDMTALHFAVHNRHFEAMNCLVKAGADICAMNKKKCTPLDDAVERVWLDAIINNVIAGSHEEGLKKDGDSALHVLARLGHAEALRFILGSGEDVIAQENDDDSALHVLARLGHAAALKLILDSGADVNAQNNDGESALHVLARLGHAEALKLILGSGADVNAQNNDGHCAIHIASQHGQGEALKILLLAGANKYKKIRNNDGHSAFHVASQYGQIEAIKILLGRLAYLNVQNDSFPLTYITKTGRRGNMRFLKAQMSYRDQSPSVVTTYVLFKNDPIIEGILIELGKDEMIKFFYMCRFPSGSAVRWIQGETKEVRNGDTALHIALQHGQVETIKFLLDSGADVNAQNNNGDTPLHKTLQHGQIEAIKFLLDSGADVNAQNNNGDTALHIALQHGQVEAIKFLMDSGADVNAKNNNGDTALHIALQHGQIEAIKFLMDSGADVNAQNNFGQTLLHCSVMQGSNEAVITLLMNGVDVQKKDKDGRTALDLAREGCKEILLAWQNIPKEIKQLGDEAVAAFLRAIGRGSFSSNLIRCMFVGHFGVGKTTLVHNIFGNGSEFTCSTNGIDVYLGKCYFNKETKKWHVQDEHSEIVLGVDDIIQIDIWDFAGQLIFYTTHQTYMSCRCLYFLVFDLSMGLHGEVQDESLDPTNNTQREVIHFLEFWIGSIGLYAKGGRKGFPKILLIGTHMDKLRTRGQLRDIMSEIYETFQHLIESGQLVVREDLFVNALDLSRAQINTIREVMLECGQQYPEFEEKIPASWAELHKTLYNLKREGQLVLTHVDVEKINEETDNPLKNDELELFLLYLHGVGYILYFSDPSLRMYVILDPKWLIEAMRCIFSLRQFLYRLWDKKEWKMMRTTGKVKKSYIEKVWKRNKQSALYTYRQHLLLVMEKLDLICKPKIYDLKGNDLDPEFYYIRSMINASVPADLKEKPSAPISMTYEFKDIIPPALFNRLVASCLCLWQVNVGQLYNGLVVLKSGKYHQLKVKKEYRAINITVIHTRGDEVDLNLCRAVRLFFSQTIHRILATYDVDSSVEHSDLFRITYHDALQYLSLPDTKEV